jgi:AraC-like DNA-binding protein
MSTDPGRQSNGTSRHPSPTAWSRVAAELVRRAESAAIPRGELLARSGLRDDDLAHLDGRVPLERLYDLVEAIEELSHDPLVHMRITARIELSSLEALAFAVLTSATLGDGIRVVLKFQRLFTEGERFDLEEDDDWARLTYRPWGPERRAHALMAEMFAVDILVNAGRIIGAGFERPRACFVHARRGDAEEHRALLAGVTAEFEQPRCEIMLRRSDLALPIAKPGQEPIRAFFEQHLEQRVRELGDDSVASAVREVLGRASSLHDDVASVARRLHLSARTLQRRLADERTSLRAIVEDVRRARALQLLATGRSIAEIADQLGFAEPTAFHRAFRRWTGLTPQQHRARTRG